MYSGRGWKNSVFTMSLMVLMFCVIAQVLGVPPTPKRKVPPIAAPVKVPKRTKVVTKPSKSNAVTKKTTKAPPKEVVVLPEMVRIPGGTFQMGSNTGQADEKPIHSVTLGSFSMSKYEVTVGQYESYCKDSGKPMPDAPSYNTKWSRKDHPVVNVSWKDAMAYCKWLSKKTGKSYDLPTEAEWEYASRGGLAGKAYPWGDEWDEEKCANSVGSNNLKGTMPVGSYAANGYGLYDMAGNVWEWCKDSYGSDYYSSSPSVNPPGPATGEYRVLRGGSWDYFNPGFFRCAIRFRSKPANWVDGIGFRPVFH